ncbi:hypothetical protein TNCV_422351 [Trichonephila clavipes]|nr:hypothetical protein TNCV_422351 [Trichonephila clavipes]
MGRKFSPYSGEYKMPVLYVTCNSGTSKKKERKQEGNIVKGISSRPQGGPQHLEKIRSRPYPRKVCPSLLQGAL